MKVALIALSGKHDPSFPPLTLAYVAAILEQRRHIARLYDRALPPLDNWRELQRRLHAFQPQRIIIGGEHSHEIERAAAQIHELYPDILPLYARRSGSDAPTAVTGALEWIDGNAVSSSLPANDLPYPARHLLSLEQYGLRAPGGEIQTPVVIGWNAHGQWHLREPRQIIQEMRAIATEFGIRHVLFREPALTSDSAWLEEFLSLLEQASLGIQWAATVDIDQLNNTLIEILAQAGCEALSFTLAAASVFDSASSRQHVRNLISQAQSHHIETQATVLLEPPYESIARLIDVAATFGLNEVSFELMQTLRVGDDEQQIQRFARQRYQERRSRQRLIDRFGATLGGLLWQLRVQGLEDDV